jgi:hypothetical protein
MLDEISGSSRAFSLLSNSICNTDRRTVKMYYSCPKFCRSYQHTCRKLHIGTRTLKVRRGYGVVVLQSKNSSQIVGSPLPLLPSAYSVSLRTVRGWSFLESTQLSPSVRSPSSTAGSKAQQGPYKSLRRLQMPLIQGLKGLLSWSPSAV